MVTPVLPSLHRVRTAVLATLLAAGASRGQATPVGQPPVLTTFSINRGDTVSANSLEVALIHTFVGARPSDYRVSHRADFLGAPWQPYADVLFLRDWDDRAGEVCDSTLPSHRVTLYFQIRATLGEEVRIVDGQRQLQPLRVESNVLKASICARTDRQPP